MKTKVEVVTTEAVELGEATLIITEVTQMTEELAQVEVKDREVIKEKEKVIITQTNRGL